MSGADSKFILQCLAGEKGKTVEELELEALETAMEALEREIPTYAIEYDGIFYCRPCVMPLPKINGNYCPCCGHKVFYQNKEENENTSKSME